LFISGHSILKVHDDNDMGIPGVVGGTYNTLEILGDFDKN
jgi:hypothetical protein